jgi:YggT family protein
MQSALIFLVKTLADLYLLTFLLRFILQWIRASYYNPLSQFVLRVTAPLVIPARRVIPSVAGLDVPTLLVLTLLEALVTWLLLKLVGVTAPLGTFALLTLLRLVALTLWLYSVALFVYAILSWFGDRGRNPLATVLGEIVAPILAPVRRVLPPIGGLDFSALLVMLLCQAALIALPLPQYLR